MFQMRALSALEVLSSQLLMVCKEQENDVRLWQRRSAGRSRPYQLF